MSIKKYLLPFKTAIIFSIVMFILCGLAYPLTMTGLGRLIFPSQAGGSLIYVNGQAVGSSLIGQDFTGPRFMKCRPSAVNYNTYTAQDKADGIYKGIRTGSDNYAPSNPKLWARVEADIKSFLVANPTVKKGEIPADLLTASGSGLDPHISPSSADIQIPRLAQNSELSEEALRQIVRNNTTGKFLRIFGEETVNVLGVNLEIVRSLRNGE
ncbi:MAG: potassium-transporting ATPase subunit KdpC [Chitinispirillia bacterium]|nr:potassium-transporting ATPase subunit KdpC [Chitinispirillia bacterium]